MNKPIIKTELYSCSAEKEVGTAEHNYNGFAIHALQGLHEHIVQLVSKIFPRRARLLDAAAGSGALSLRLHNMDYEMMACDFVAENFRVADRIDFFQVDLNTEFSGCIDKVIDGVVAIEIIEHLENPRHFLREIFALLSPGGTLVLTTPNVDNPVSLAFFVRLGWFQWFADENYENQGHIAPITQWSLRRFLKEAGYEGIEFGSFGDPFRVLQDWPKMRLFAKGLRFLSAASGRAQGEILVVTAMKPE